MQEGTVVYEHRALTHSQRQPAWEPDPLSALNGLFICALHFQEVRLPSPVMTQEAKK